MNPELNPLSTLVSAKPKRKFFTPRTTVALSLIIGPTAILIIAYIIFTIMYHFESTRIEPGTPILYSLGTIALFYISVFAVLALIPSLVVGIVLLVKKPKQSHK